MDHSAPLYLIILSTYNSCASLWSSTLWLSVGVSLLRPVQVEHQYLPQSRKHLQASVIVYEDTGQDRKRLCLSCAI